MAVFPYVGFLDGVAYPTIPAGTTTVNVTTSAGLTTALANATAGQRIVLANGTYSGAFTVSAKVGSASSGISIEAATTGGAIFGAGSTFTVSNSAYVTIKGLSFPYELSTGNLVQFRGSSHHCRVTRCLFGPTAVGTSGANKTPFVYLGDDVNHIRIDHNEFRNKANPGNTILGDGNFTTSQVVKHIRIDHNVLRSIKPEVTNEKEPIRLGVSTMSKTFSYSVVERNFFLDCICEPEIVSVKACGVRVTGNTVLRSIGGLVYRHGTNGVMNDNYIVDRVQTFGTTIGSGGFRFYDAGHEIAYNYVDAVYGGNFQNALTIDSGDAEGSSTNLAGHWRVVNAVVERNVLVGSPTGIVIGHNYSLAPTGCTIRDNIVAQTPTGTAVTQKVAPVSTTQTGNLYGSTPGAVSLGQDSQTIWRRLGYGPRLTYLQQADVGVTGDLNDTDGTGVLISTGTAPQPTGTAPVGQTTVFTEGFDAGLSKWASVQTHYYDDPASGYTTTGAYSLQIVNNSSAHPHVLRTEVRDGDTAVGSHERSEISGFGKVISQRNDERWYEFDVRFGDPTWSPSWSGSSDWLIFFQWHQVVNDGAPALAMAVHNDNKVYFEREPDTDLEFHGPLWTIRPGVWEHVVVHVKWATDTTGFIECYVNDVQVLPKTFRKTQYVSDFDDYYLKMGQYRRSTVSGTTVIEHDNIRISGPPAGTSTTPLPVEVVSAAERFGWGQPLDVSDEFSYAGAPNSSKWGVYNEPGHGGNGRRLPARVTVDGATLVGTGLSNGDSFGMEHRFNQQYGRWEVRMRAYQNVASNGNDYHPALIIWPQSDRWPEDGEYDFVELSVPGQQALGALIHYPHDANVSVQQESFSRNQVDTAQFHNYAIEWTPEWVKGFVDGEEWFVVSGGANVVRRNIQDMPAGHLTIQLDNFDGTIQTPATMEVQWARVYSLTPTGGSTGAQTIGVFGIGSAERIGQAAVSAPTGPGTPPPLNSVPTQLGQNLVLGSGTLTWTLTGGGPGPGQQLVSGAGRIGTGAAFGLPSLTVPPGDQVISPGSIPPVTLFGAPAVFSDGAPPPAPGGVLVPALYAVGRDGTTLTPLPHWQSIKVVPVRNSMGTIEVTYPYGAPGFDLLGGGVSATPLRALEVRIWLGGSNSAALGGWLVQKSGDDLVRDAVWTFTGHFHEWLLSKAIIYPQAISEANKSGALTFAGATAGLIFATMMDQAQARGALPLVTRDFTTTHDSNGQPWANSISSLKLAPKTTLIQVAEKLVELGMCEFELTPARMWRAYNADGRGVDRATGSSPLTFAQTVNLRERSRRESSREAGTAVLVAGTEGFYATASSATAQAELGWRAEVGVDAGQLNSAAAVQAVAGSYLDRTRAGVAEYAAGVEFGVPGQLPLIDYGIGDWALLRVGTRYERQRIVQLELEFAQNAIPRGTVEFNDLITDRMVALYRRLNAISTGDAVVGTSESTPGGPGEDTIPPAAPQGVTVASAEAYQQPGESETYALVIVGWAPVTTNAYADAATADKARAADLISDRFDTRLAIAEDWTWSGVPAVVSANNTALLEEWKSAPTNPGGDGSTLTAEAQDWLAGYALSHQGGGSITNDVSHYRVQWRFLGAQVVPSREDPGNGVPGEPVPPRDPNAFPDDAAWFEPIESPTTNTRIEFGGVLAGRPISVRVSAVDRSGNQSPWSTPVGVVTASDNQPPPAPSKPIAVPWFETANVTWDGKGSAGEDMFAAAPDIASGGRVELHMALGIDFTPDRPTGADGRTVDLAQSTTYITDFQWAGTTNVADLSIGTTYYFRFVAVDKTGNASEPSETSDGVLPQQLVNIQIGPDAIARAQIIDGEIVNAKIANGAVNDLKVSNVSVGKLTAGTMNANVVIGGRFETPLTNGNQIQLDAAGLRLYRGGSVIGRWQVFDSSMLMTGQFNSAVTGQRVVINPGGSNPDTIRLYPTFSDVYSSIDSVDFQGGTIAGIRIVGSGTTSTSNRGMVVVRDQYASIVHGRTDLSYWGSEIWVEQNFTRNKSATVDLIIDERLTPIGGERRVAMIHYNSAGQPINATGLYYKKTAFNGGEPFLYGNGQDVGLVFGGGRLVVSNNPNQARRGIIAAEFVVESSREVKCGFRDVDGDPLRHLRMVKPQHFKLKAEPDDQPEKLGFIAEDMPAAVRTEARMSGTDDQPDRTIVGLDYNAITALEWAILQRIDERVSTLESALQLIDTKEP